MVAMTGIKSSDRGGATAEDAVAVAGGGGGGWPVGGTKSGVVTALVGSRAECCVLEDTDERRLDVAESEFDNSASPSFGW